MFINCIPLRAKFAILTYITDSQFNQSDLLKTYKYKLHKNLKDNGPKFLRGYFMISIPISPLGESWGISRKSTIDRTIIIEEYRSTLSIAANINTHRNVGTIIHRSSWRFHRLYLCLSGRGQFHRTIDALTSYWLFCCLYITTRSDSTYLYPLFSHFISLLHVYPVLYISTGGFVCLRSFDSSFSCNFRLLSFPLFAPFNWYDSTRHLRKWRTTRIKCVLQLIHG